MDQAQDARVPDPMFQKPTTPILADRIEKALDIKIKDIVHLFVSDSDRQRIQRIVLAAPGAEAV